MRRADLAWRLLPALLCHGLAAAAPQTHEHGAVKLDVAIDGGRLTINLEAPLDSLFGFERAPRDDTQRRVAADALAQLRDGARLFRADAAARCTFATVAIDAPALDPGAGPAGAGDHADLDAHYTFDCAQPGRLTALEIGLFEAFKRIQRIDVQLAGPKGQGRSTLIRPSRSVKLSR